MIIDTILKNTYGTLNEWKGDISGEELLKSIEDGKISGVIKEKFSEGIIKDEVIGLLDMLIKKVLDLHLGEWVSDKGKEFYHPLNNYNNAIRFVISKFQTAKNLKKMLDDSVAKDLIGDSLEKYYKHKQNKIFVKNEEAKKTLNDFTKKGDSFESIIQASKKLIEFCKKLERKPETTEKIQYQNKPYFIQLKRIYRFVKTIEDKNKKYKNQFYEERFKKLSGDKKITEQIINRLFKNIDSISPKELIDKLEKMDTPKGESLIVNPESDYQHTQRLFGKAELVKKTLSVSIYNNLFSDIFSKYENEKWLNSFMLNLISMSSHFKDSAVFIRWTTMKDNWIHIDTFQTDLFNKLRYIASKDSMYNGIVNDFIKHEEDFYKTAFSYIKRKNTNVKIWTANTPEMIKRAEKIKSEAKAGRLYRELPKKLGFKLISTDQFLKILKTRSNEKTENLAKYFKEISLPVGAEGLKEGDVTFIEKCIDKIEDALFSTINYAMTTLSEQHVDAVISDTAYDFESEYSDAVIRTSVLEQLVSALHQRLKIIYRIVISKNANVKLPEYFKKELYSITKEVESSIKDVRFDKIWWATREMLTESSSIDQSVDSILNEVAKGKKFDLSPKLLSKLKGKDISEDNFYETLLKVKNWKLRSSYGKAQTIFIASSEGNLKDYKKAIKVFEELDDPHKDIYYVGILHSLGRISNEAFVYIFNLLKNKDLPKLKNKTYKLKEGIQLPYPYKSYYDIPEFPRKLIEKLSHNDITEDEFYKTILRTRNWDKKSITSTKAYAIYVAGAEEIIKDYKKALEVFEKVVEPDERDNLLAGMLKDWGNISNKLFTMVYNKIKNKSKRLNILPNKKYKLK